MRGWLNKRLWALGRARTEYANAMYFGDDWPQRSACFKAMDLFDTLVDPGAEAGFYAAQRVLTRLNAAKGAKT